MFVMFVTFTTVFVTFTCRKYSRLTRYGGTYTSRGASGNQPIAGPDDTAMPKPAPPTKATSAGA